MVRSLYICQKCNRPSYGKRGAPCGACESASIRGLTHDQQWCSERAAIDDAMLQILAEMIRAKEKQDGPTISIRQENLTKTG